MKNTNIAEISEARETVCFPEQASLSDLLDSLRKNGRIQNFYLVDDREGILRAVLTKNCLLEFLAPLICTTERRYTTALEDKLSRIGVAKLGERNFPSLYPDQSLPEALALFVEHNRDYLPLIDRKGKFLGEISADSLLKALPSRFEEQLYAV
ncbi:MAG: CBS domain-containing protein [Spirochaetales bacterium]|nr:CBS domain-containing protein [Spirochaetales bacterium]